MTKTRSTLPTPSTAPTMALLLSWLPRSLLSLFPCLPLPLLPLPLFFEAGGGCNDLCGGVGDLKEGGECDEAGGEGVCGEVLGDGGLGLVEVGGEGEDFSDGVGGGGDEDDCGGDGGGDEGGGGDGGGDEFDGVEEELSASSGVLLSGVLLSGVESSGISLSGELL
ncbi:hypothetical protein VIGAN_10166300 [Vigna angularis var. angularis]|uniref:Uncharacterized protein n=1 Tax=Vigna angularis var. angularis TaxID=157739 RepID=A0A0S3T5A3_PHAAN|nr:hypothetical protein VIGAN_10166300 [Vigna angularis var. angularis]